MIFCTELESADPVLISCEAGVQTLSKSEFGVELSRTIWDADAPVAQATVCEGTVSAHERNVCPSSEPKKSDPEGVEKEVTDEEISRGVIEPNNANSKMGSERREERRSGSDGGAEDEDNTKSMSLEARVMLELEIDDR